MQSTATSRSPYFLLAPTQPHKPLESLIHMETGCAFDLKRLYTLFYILNNCILETEVKLKHQYSYKLNETLKGFLKLDAWLSYSLDTGARQKEIKSRDKKTGELRGMKRSLIKNNWQFWKRGKNQTGSRKALISKPTQAKINRMWDVCGLPSNDFVFETCNDAMHRSWNRFKNAYLPSEFHETYDIPKKDIVGTAQKYSLKSFRKTFAVAMFDYYWNKYNDPVMALERVQEALGHKSKEMTWQHYAKEIERVGRGHYRNLFPFQLLDAGVRLYGQYPLMMFYE